VTVCPGKRELAGFLNYPARANPGSDAFLDHQHFGYNISFASFP
jgi:hypothetical protein